MGDSIRGTQNGINGLAGQALGYFEALGQTAQGWGFGPQGTEGTPMRRSADHIDFIGNTTSALQGVDAGRASTKALREFAMGELPGTYTEVKLTGAISKGIQFFGNAVNATTGVLDLSAAYARDRERGDTLLSGTLAQTVKSTAQIGLGSLAGGAAFAMAGGAAAVGGAVVLPVVLGVGAAAAAGYAAGKVLDWIF